MKFLLESKHITFVFLTMSPILGSADLPVRKQQNTKSLITLKIYFT